MAPISEFAFNMTGEQLGALPTFDEADPWNQSIVLQIPGGRGLILNLADIDAAHTWALKLCVSYGAQVGAVGIMGFVLFITNTKANRLKALFALNLSSLILAFISRLIMVLYFFSSYAPTYTWFVEDFSHVKKGDTATQLAATVINLFLTVTVSSSLVLQAFTVTNNVMTKRVVLFVRISSVLIVILAVSFRSAQTITNAMAIASTSYYPPGFLRLSVQVTGTSMIWWFTAIFVSKLIAAIITRKKNGWRQYGAFKIMAIMGGCTMIIPSCFTILQYTSVESFPEAGTWVLTFAAIMLPLSSIWARMSIEEENASLRVTNLANMEARSNSASRRPSASPTGVASHVQNSVSAVSVHDSVTNTVSNTVSDTVAGLSTERKGSLAFTGTTIASNAERARPGSSRSARTPRDSTEIEMERLGMRVDGVRVDRTFSVS